MVEFVGPQHGHLREGHLPNTETALLELHRLVAIFLASQSFAALQTNYPGEGFDPIFRLQSCEEDEITRLLLVLAVTARVIDDREGRVFDTLVDTCGTLWPDTSKESQSGLTLREACNKIIHARKLRYDVEDDDSGNTYFTPLIYVYGRHQGLEWKANIDLIAFAKQYVTALTFV